jgi:disease resistance protein RPS2
LYSYVVLLAVIFFKLVASHSKTLGMEVVASIVGGAIDCFFCCEDPVKLLSNLDILENEMKGLLFVKDVVKNETELAEKEGKVLRTQVMDWLNEVEELQLKVSQIQAVKPSRRSLNSSKQYKISTEVAEKLKDIQGLLEAGRSHSGAVAEKLKLLPNLDILENEMEGLLFVKDVVENEIELAEKEGKVLRTQVMDWLNEVEELQLKVSQIQAVKPSQRSLNSSKQYKISTEVAEKLKDVRGLLEAGRSHSGAVAVNHSIAVEHIPGPIIQDQTTPSKTLAEIMALLCDDEVRRIGVWGMGGVGKTTLVRTLNNNLKNISSMQPFGIIIWVTISQNLDMKKVQTQIARRLNLKVKTEDSPEQIAIQLYQRLQEEIKFLLILDDVRKEIDLDNFGVPQPKDHKGSKILLTTRSFDVCRLMMTDRDVKVAVVNDDESWQLFSRNAGNSASLQHISPIAKEIARECCGLPLALVTMGAAMREKTNVELWKHALNGLQRAAVSCPPHIVDKIYKPLKWCYDSLDGARIKYCFLYCSLFPEDFSIEISELTQCWLAEGLLDEEENYEDSFNRVIDLIGVLKDSCLLEDGAHEDTVKMCAIVRDVAIWIASTFEDGCKSLVCSGIGLSEMPVFELFDNSLKRVSFMNNKIRKLPDCVVRCSEASTLLLQGNATLGRVPERFWEGFEALRVLNISGTHIHSLPLSLLKLGELRALLLGDCFYLVELPPLEGLSRLQVLDLSATGIRELPRGMENLSNLKQLNLSRTNYLKTIQAGIICRLSCLEVLDMTLSGYCFSVNRDVKEEMACFEELKCLEQLLVVYISLKSIPPFSNEDLCWIDRLRKFHFSIGHTGKFLPTRHENRAVSISSLDFHSEELIGPLLSSASSLNLGNCLGLSDMLEDLVNNSIVCFVGLKSLTIQSCRCSEWQGGCAAQYDLLPNLEELYLQDLNFGESISELLGRLGLRFLRLKLIEVEWCYEMKYLVSFGHFIHALPNLQVIKVRNCYVLEKLFSYDSMQYIAPDPVVPSLQILELLSLPQLSTLCRDEETWPLLEKVYVFGCNYVRKLPLTDQNAENIKEIKGESQWWNALAWPADTTKSNLRPYFHPIRAILEPREEVLSDWGAQYWFLPFECV